MEPCLLKGQSIWSQQKMVEAMVDNRKIGRIHELLDIMQQLRTPETGCPWDLEQDFSTIAPYTIEEAYEVADAIEKSDLHSLKDELGDLMFQVVFHSQMAAEQEEFTFSDVIDSISDKMIRRHPHVFGHGNVITSEEQTVSWEEIKAAEREAKGNGTRVSILDDVPVGMPAMSRAVKLQKRAARVGFDWPSTLEVFNKIKEETRELEVEIQANRTEAIEEEFGDLLFVFANLARHLGIDPEKAVRKTNAKFERRFKGIEQELDNKGKNLSDCSLEELDGLWDMMKEKEHK